jgi:putative aldouronate transport system permease protein
MKIHSARPERAFQAFNYILLTLLGLIMLYPFWEIIKVSFSDPLEVGRSGYRIWPIKSSLEGYIHVFKNEFVWLGYKNTIFRVIVAMSVQMALMILTAYPLSKRNLPNRNVITMLSCLRCYSTGDSPRIPLSSTAALDIASGRSRSRPAINTFSMLILPNFFMPIPTEMRSRQKSTARHLWILDGTSSPLYDVVQVTVQMWWIVQNWNACLTAYLTSWIIRNMSLQAVHGNRHRRVARD